MPVPQLRVFAFRVNKPPSFTSTKPKSDASRPPNSKQGSANSKRKRDSDRHAPRRPRQSKIRDKGGLLTRFACAPTPVRVTSISSESSSRKRVKTTIRRVTSPLDNVRFPKDIDKIPASETFSVEDVHPITSSSTMHPSGTDAPNSAGIVVFDETLEGKVKKRYKNSDNPMATFIEHRATYLDASLRLEGRGRWGTSCARCSAKNPTWRCNDCFGSWLWCRECMVDIHDDAPLHRISEWTGTFFAERTMEDLGITIQLGHLASEICAVIPRTIKSFLVMHTNGLHRLKVDFCGCQLTGEGYSFLDQVLDFGWWPGTSLAPECAATNELLRLYSSLMPSGVTAYQMCKTLADITDPHRQKGFPNPYESFKRIFQEFCHIKLCKRAGRGHDNTGIPGTAPGELAIPCRLCPQASNVASKDAFLSREETTLNLGIDCNFRLGNFAHGASDEILGLGNGLAYMANEEEMLLHVASYASQDEVSHCSAFAALAFANKKASKGLRATGLAAISCSHGCIRPLGLGNLQKGERYCNVDYLLALTLRDSPIKYLNLSYDIVCQWSKKLGIRLDQLPESLRWRILIEDITTGLPKFHETAHVEDCQGDFSLRYKPLTGRIDGEWVERIWAMMNPLAPSTRLMTAGARCLTIDVSADRINFAKESAIEDSLQRTLTEAMEMAKTHGLAFQALTDGMRESFGAEIESWENSILEWEADNTKPNPYKLRAEHVTLAELKVRFAQQDSYDVPIVRRAHTSQSFILQFLDLEQTQIRLKVDVLKPTQTTVEARATITRRSKLLKDINMFREVQKQYMPGLAQHLKEIDHAFDDRFPEDIPLFPPSSFTSNERARICQEDLVEVEESVREASALDALGTLRHQLRTRASTKRFKKKNVTGQRHNTRFRELQNGVEVRIKRATLTYQRSHSALLRLRGEGDWLKRLRPLNDTDVVGINERLLSKVEEAELERARQLSQDSIDQLNVQTYLADSLHPGEGRRILSWIWYEVSRDEVENELSGHVPATVKVEWCRARARAMRWKEAVRMTQEEMKRALRSTKSNAIRWNTLKATRQTNDPLLLEGLVAYCEEKRLQELCYHDRWSVVWRPLLDLAESLEDEREREIVKVELKNRLIDEELDLEDEVEE